jgi:hypothetical protein
MTKEAETTKKPAAPEKVTLRNRDIRGVTLITADNKSLFIGPKSKVTVLKADISKTMRNQIKQGLVTQEE